MVELVIVRPFHTVAVGLCGLPALSTLPLMPLSLMRWMVVWSIVSPPRICVPWMASTLLCVSLTAPASPGEVMSWMTMFLKVISPPVLLRWTASTPEMFWSVPPLAAVVPVPVTVKKPAPVLSSVIALVEPPFLLMLRKVRPLPPIVVPVTSSAVAVVVVSVLPEPVTSIVPPPVAEKALLAPVFAMMPPVKWNVAPLSPLSKRPVPVSLIEPLRLTVPEVLLTMSIECPVPDAPSVIEPEKLIAAPPPETKKTSPAFVLKAPVPRSTVPPTVVSETLFAVVETKPVPPVIATEPLLRVKPGPVVLMVTFSTVSVPKGFAPKMAAPVAPAAELPRVKPWIS